MKRRALVLPAFLVAVPIETLDPGPNGFYSYSMAALGDVNGDGYQDLLVGAYMSGNGSAGMAHLYAGSTNGPSGTIWTETSDETNAWLGAVVRSAGDVDGDGYGDFLIGAPQYSDPSYEGLCQVWSGDQNPFYVVDPEWSVTGALNEDWLGRGGGGIGDINGDGYDDILVGETAYDAGGEEMDSRVVLYLGSATGLDTTPASPGFSLTTQDSIIDRTKQSLGL